MSFQIFRPSRRAFMSTIALGGAAVTARGGFADELAKTPRIQEGPYYPTKLPLDTDNDLLIINDSRIGELAATFDVVLGVTPES